MSQVTETSQGNADGRGETLTCGRRDYPCSAALAHGDISRTFSPHSPHSPQIRYLTLPHKVIPKYHRPIAESSEPS